MARKDHGTYTLSPAPQKAAEEMMSIIANLQKIYQQETEALETSNISIFMTLQDQKLQAARWYERGITQILDRRDEMKDVPEELKKNLRVMQKDFSVLASKNKKALERMQRTTERLGETIRGAAKDVIEKRVATSYSAEGALNKHKKGNMSVGISETA